MKLQVRGGDKPNFDCRFGGIEATGFRSRVISLLVFSMITGKTAVKAFVVKLFGNNLRLMHIDFVTNSSGEVCCGCVA